MFISIPNRPIDKFYRSIFHKAVSIFDEDLEKNLQLTFCATLYITHCIAAVSIAGFFELCFSALLLSLLFAFILYFISFYFHYIFSV